MYHARDRAGRRPWRSLLLGAVSLTALLLCLGPGTATACINGGAGCLPGTGYTFDDIWNCGTITEGEQCFHDGTLSSGSASVRFWGWGSASYGGTGEYWICVRTARYFGGCGTNLARACAIVDCNAQSSVSMTLWVENTTRTFHTISGHGKS